MLMLFLLVRFAVDKHVSRVYGCEAVQRRGPDLQSVYWLFITVCMKCPRWLPTIIW